MKKHHVDLISDPTIPKVDVVCLQETWLEENSNLDTYLIPEFYGSFNSVKRGKGVATFLKDKTKVINVKHVNFQMSKIVRNDCDIISVYRSQDENHEIVQHLSELIDSDKPTIILGDINLNLLKDCHHPLIGYLKQIKFSQHVQSPTHEQGGLIDPVYASHHFTQDDLHIVQQCVYYSDHDLIHVKIKIREEQKP